MTRTLAAPYRFSISEPTTRPWSFDEDMSRHAALCDDGNEVVEAKLDDDRLAEQMASIAAAGLGIHGVLPTVRTFFASRMAPDPAGLDERYAVLRSSSERLGRYVPGVPFIINTAAVSR